MTLFASISNLFEASFAFNVSEFDFCSLPECSGRSELPVFGISFIRSVSAHISNIPSSFNFVRLIASLVQQQIHFRNGKPSRVYPPPALFKLFIKT